MFGIAGDATVTPVLVDGMTNAANDVIANVAGVLPVVLPVLGVLLVAWTVYRLRWFLGWRR